VASVIRSSSTLSRQGKDSRSAEEKQSKQEMEAKGVVHYTDEEEEAPAHALVFGWLPGGCNFPEGRSSLLDQVAAPVSTPVGSFRFHLEKQAHIKGVK